MSDNENTARRGIYLPKELDQFFVDEAKETGKRINTIMLDALIMYKEMKADEKKNAEKALEEKIDKMVEERLKKEKKKK